MFQILTHKIDEDVEKSKRGESLGFESTLPVSYTNSDMFTSLQVGFKAIFGPETGKCSEKPASPAQESSGVLPQSGEQH